MLHKQVNAEKGFTLVELIMVVVILGVLAAYALPKLSNLSRDARTASVDSIAGAMRATISVVRAKARITGLTTVNNHNVDQSDYLITTEAGTFEVHYQSLCPETRSEEGDAISFEDSLGFDLTRGMAISAVGVWGNPLYIGYDLDDDGESSDDACYAQYEQGACEVITDTSGC